MTKRKSTIQKVVTSGLCIGCSGCKGICPKDSISISYSAPNGYYQASINEATCVECGLCQLVCPFSKVGKKEYPEINTVVTGYSSKPEVRRFSASGGFVSGISMHLLNTDEVDYVLAVENVGGTLFEYRKMSSASQWEQFCGSVYAPVNTATLYDILDSSDERDRIAVVGLPCVLSALEAVRKKKKRYSNISYLIGLFCGRLPNRHATEYLFKKAKVVRTEEASISYRGPEWQGGISISENGKERFSAPYKGAYGMGCLLSSSVFMPQSCYYCNDALALSADISVGDAWLKELIEDTKGWSMAIALSKKGETLIEKMKNSSDTVIQDNSANDLHRAQHRIIKRKTRRLYHRALVTNLHNGLKDIDRTGVRDVFSGHLFLQELFLRCFMEGSYSS